MSDTVTIPMPLSLQVGLLVESLRYVDGSHKLRRSIMNARRRRGGSRWTLDQLVEIAMRNFSDSERRAAWRALGEATFRIRQLPPRLSA